MRTRNRRGIAVTLVRVLRALFARAPQPQRGLGELG
jgi:hypothetical protein